MKRIAGILGLASLALAGCETARMATNVATSKNPQQAMNDTLKQRGDQYLRNPEAVIRDAATLKRDFDKVVDLLTGNVKKTWGPKEVKLPSRTHYVKTPRLHEPRRRDFTPGPSRWRP